MVRVLSFLIRYFSNYYTLHRSDLAARAAPLDPRLAVRRHRKVQFINNQNSKHAHFILSWLGWEKFLVENTKIFNLKKSAQGE